MHIPRRTYCCRFLQVLETSLHSSSLTGCHMLSDWFACIDLVMFTIRKSTVFSIIHRNVM